VALELRATSRRSRRRAIARARGGVHGREPLTVVGTAAELDLSHGGWARVRCLAHRLDFCIERNRRACVFARGAMPASSQAR
jgi:hypothetical protein